MWTWGLRDTAGVWRKPSWTLALAGCPPGTSRGGSSGRLLNGPPQRQRSGNTQPTHLAVGKQRKRAAVEPPRPGGRAGAGLAQGSLSPSARAEPKPRGQRAGTCQRGRRPAQTLIPGHTARAREPCHVRGVAESVRGSVGAGSPRPTSAFAVLRLHAPGTPAPARALHWPPSAGRGQQQPAGESPARGGGRPGVLRRHRRSVRHWGASRTERKNGDAKYWKALAFTKDEETPEGLPWSFGAGRARGGHRMSLSRGYPGTGRHPRLS